MTSLNNDSHLVYFPSILVPSVTADCSIFLSLHFSRLCFKFIDINKGRDEMVVYDYRLPSWLQQLKSNCMDLLITDLKERWKETMCFRATNQETKRIFVSKYTVLSLHHSLKIRSRFSSFHDSPYFFFIFLPSIFSSNHYCNPCLREKNENQMRTDLISSFATFSYI